MDTSAEKVPSPISPQDFEPKCKYNEIDNFLPPTPAPPNTAGSSQPDSETETEGLEKVVMSKLCMHSCSNGESEIALSNDNMNFSNDFDESSSDDDSDMMVIRQSPRRFVQFSDSSSDLDETEFGFGESGSPEFWASIENELAVTDDSDDDADTSVSSKSKLSNTNSEFEYCPLASSRSENWLDTRCTPRVEINTYSLSDGEEPFYFDNNAPYDDVSSLDSDDFCDYTYEDDGDCYTPRSAASVPVSNIGPYEQTLTYTEILDSSRTSLSLPDLYHQFYQEN